MTRHHPTKSPSSFPAFELCACYKSGPTGEAAQRGTIQHEALADILEGKPNRDNGITEDEIKNVLWAVEWVRAWQQSYGVRDEDLVIEKEIKVYGDSVFEEITFGTIDIGARSTIMDYKSGRKRNYVPQMACYALGWMQKHGLDEVTVHEIYGKLREVETYTITKDQCERYVREISARVDDPNKQPAKCSYCGWCEKYNTCPEIIAPVGELVGTQVDFKALTKKPIGELTAGDFDTLIPIAGIAAKWAKTILEKAKEKLVAGEEMEHYYLKTGAGSRFVSDVMELKKFSGLPYKDILEYCAITIGNLEKLALEKLASGDKSKAKKIIEEKFGPVIGMKAGSSSITEK